MVNFPVSLDDDTILYLVVNNLRTSLTANITDTDTTILVSDTTGFPASGFISILTGSDITKTEAIAYSTLTPTSFTGVTRGADGTTAFPHNSGSNVDFTIVADHHNSLKDAVFALESFVGASGSENFVPRDAFGNSTIPGNLIISGTLDVPIISSDVLLQGSLNVTNDISANTVTAPIVTSTTLLSSGTITAYGDLTVAGSATVSGGANICFLTVTGTSVFGDSADFKHDVVVTGTVTVGQIPQAGPPFPLYAFNDGPVLAEDQSPVDYADLGVQTSPLLTGDNLVFYHASGGNPQCTPSEPSLELRALFAGVEIGYTLDNNDGAGLWSTTNLAGFKMVTGNDVDFAKLQQRISASVCTFDVGAMGIVAVPLDGMGLILDTDYFFDNGSDTPVDKTTSFSNLTQISPSLPEDGDYLLFTCAEGSSNNGVAFQYRVLVNSQVVSPTYTHSNVTFFGTDKYKTFSFMQLVTLSSGPNTFTIQIKKGDAGVGQFRRGRIVVIKASAFDQVIGSQTNPDLGTSSSSFSELPSTSISYTPNQQEVLIVMANPDARPSNIAARPAYKLRESVNSVDYRINAGAPAQAVGEQTPTFLMHAIDTFNTTTWSLFQREGEASGNTITTSGVQMIAWGTARPPSETDIQFTTIDGQIIKAHRGEFDELTVSGIPVDITGGGGGGGAGTITDINVTATGPSVTIDGSGGIAVNTVGQTITIDGSGVAGGGGGGGTSSGTAIFRGALLTTSTGIDIAGGTSGSGDFSWNVETYDTDGFHSSDFGSITIPADVTKARFSSIVHWNDAAEGGRRTTQVLRRFPSNGGSYSSSVEAVASGGQTIQVFETPAVIVSGGEQYVMHAFYSNASTGNFEITTASFGIEVLEPVTVTGVTAIIPDPLVLASGVFSESLTVSGIPVSTGTSGSSTFRGAMLTTSSAVVIPHNVISFMPWDGTDYDTDGFLDAGLDSIIIPVGISKIRLSTSIAWELGSNSGRRQVQFEKNGTAGFQGNSIQNIDAVSDGNVYTFASTAILTVAEADEFALGLYQDTGGDLDVRSAIPTWFQIEVFE